jgi:tetratricopeptide (TPR) repeat protein
LALILMDWGRPEEAVAQATRALEIDPQVHVARYARGVSLTQLADRQRTGEAEAGSQDPRATLERAVADLEACVEAKPVSPWYLVALAQAQGRLGNYDRVRELLDTALRVKPMDEKLLTLKARAEARESFWPTSPSSQPGEP